MEQSNLAFRTLDSNGKFILKKVSNVNKNAYSYIYSL